MSRVPHNPRFAEHVHSQSQSQSEPDDALLTEQESQVLRAMTRFGENKWFTDRGDLRRLESLLRKAGLLGSGTILLPIARWERRDELGNRQVRGLSADYQELYDNLQVRGELTEHVIDIEDTVGIKVPDKYRTKPLSLIDSTVQLPLTTQRITRQDRFEVHRLVGLGVLTSYDDYTLPAVKRGYVYNTDEHAGQRESISSLLTGAWISHHPDGAVMVLDGILTGIGYRTIGVDTEYLARVLLHRARQRRQRGK